MEGRDLSLQRSDGKRQAHTASVSRSFVLAPIFASAGTVPAIGCRCHSKSIRSCRLSSRTHRTRRSRSRSRMHRSGSGCCRGRQRRSSSLLVVAGIIGSGLCAQGRLLLEAILEIKRKINVSPSTVIKNIPKPVTRFGNTGANDPLENRTGFPFNTLIPSLKYPSEPYTQQTKRTFLIGQLINLKTITRKITHEIIRALLENGVVMKFFCIDSILLTIGTALPHCGEATVANSMRWLANNLVKQIRIRPTIAQMRSRKILHRSDQKIC